MPYVAPATGAVFIDGQEPKCALRARRYRFRRYSREIPVAAPCLTMSRRRTTPAARRSHRWGIDSHNGYVSQDTLWDCILDRNREEGVVHRHVRARGLAYPATVRPGSNGFVGIMVFLQR